MHVFVFRRDLRVVDNLGLSEASRIAGSMSARLAPVFIFNPVQVDAERNPYLSERGLAFMVRCLVHLRRDDLPQLRFLWTESGDDLDALASIRGLEAVHFNSDVTPFARARDARIVDWCRTRGLGCFAHSEAEYCLVDPTAMAKPYQVYTPFLKRYLGSCLEASKARGEAGKEPGKSQGERYRRPTFAAIPAGSRLIVPVRQAIDRWGVPSDGVKSSSGESPRRQALSILSRIRAGGFAGYETTRNDLGKAQGEGTTMLGAHLKFGSVSVREAFDAAVASGGSELARQLMWRAFYDQVAFHFPRVLGGQPTDASATPEWRSNEPLHARGKYDGARFAEPAVLVDALGARRKSRTTPPVVLAALRELVESGHMHNRARMIFAVYLVRTLGVDWRAGERLFASLLVDYHPTANNGGWQWASGTGASALPPFRGLSPERQAMIHDPRGIYRSRYAIHDS